MEQQRAIVLSRIWNIERDARGRESGRFTGLLRCDDRHDAFKEGQLYRNGTSPDRVRPGAVVYYDVGVSWVPFVRR